MVFLSIDVDKKGGGEHHTNMSEMEQAQAQTNLSERGEIL